MQPACDQLSISKVYKAAQINSGQKGPNFGVSPLKCLCLYGVSSSDMVWFGLGLGKSCFVLLVLSLVLLVSVLFCWLPLV